MENFFHGLIYRIRITVERLETWRKINIEILNIVILDLREIISLLTRELVELMDFDSKGG
jgi:hypothetical protein